MPLNEGWKLVDAKSGVEVVKGATLTDFRGDTEKLDDFFGYAPHKAGSTGSVFTEGGRQAYPSVFGLKWVKK